MRALVFLALLAFATSGPPPTRERPNFNSLYVNGDAFKGTRPHRFTRHLEEYRILLCAYVRYILVQVHDTWDHKALLAVLSSLAPKGRLCWRVEAGASVYENHVLGAFLDDGSDRFAGQWSRIYLEVMKGPGTLSMCYV